MKRILIVDDSATVRAVVTEALRPTYDIIEAENGKMALDILNDESFDAIITDINMPILNGIELIKKIKVLKLHRFKPIIALTDDPAVKEETKKAGAGAYLKKPFSPDQIMAILRMVVGS